MVAIRATFDGKSFVPEQPVDLPADSSAWIIVDQIDPAAGAAFDQAVRDYYLQAQREGDREDDEWLEVSSQNLHRAWEED